ncbi:Farnesyl pyrophosphate synthase [Papilio machaon]|uniref:Farnesyl pyrophosphate synthase n=1 Tax=Papilio machaon TaxID=76193 RepID=A0A194QQ61_PAPMA|nr:Farnesyl pyrophosphate synthase [Papilio machaon]
MTLIYTWSNDFLELAFEVQGSSLQFQLQNPRKYRWDRQRKIRETTLVEKKYADIKLLKERVINIAEHEALAREPIHGNLTMFAFDALAHSTDLNEKKLHQIQVLAWGVELLQTYYNIGDDIEDNAKTRSGKPCWHQLPGVGLMAINDADLIRSFIYEMVKNNIEEPIACTVQNYLNELQTYYNIGDDIEDNAKTRSGKPCWHQLPGVGLMAINDADLIRSFIYEMVKNNIEEPIAYTVQNYLNETYFALNIGQLMDISLTRSNDFDQFTMEYYNLLNYFKSAFYTVKLPILLALSICNLHSKEAYMHVDKVCSDLGILLQMQNDIMDYVDSKSASLKTSSDIQNRKCSWPAVAFLENCNISQRKEFESCYGQSEPEKVERVRRLYKEIDILKIYRQHEQKRYDSMMEQIKQLPVDSIPSKEFFVKILNVLQNYTEDISPSKS